MADIQLFIATDMKKIPRHLKLFKRAYLLKYDKIDIVEDNK